MTSANSARQLMSYRVSVQSPTSPVFSPGTATTTQDQPPPLPANPPRQLSSTGQQPPPLPSNPPRQLQARTKSPTGSTGSGRTVSSESIPVSPDALDDPSSCLRTPNSSSNGSCPPVKPARTNSRLSKTSATMSSDCLRLPQQHSFEVNYSEHVIPPTSHASSLVDILSVCLCGTAERPLTGALLGIGHRDVLTTSAEIKAANGTVYRRNPNGVYFQVVESWSAVDGLTSLVVGDEVLAIDRYKMVDMSIETARMLLEDRALLGDVTIVIARQNSTAAALVDVDDMQQLQLQNGVSCSSRLNTSQGPGEAGEQPAMERLVLEMFRESSAKGLGVKIFGGVDVKGPPNVIIRNIYPNGIAADDGRLLIGDEILAINDEYLAGLTNHEVSDRIKQIPNGLIHLVVLRPENTKQPLNNNNNNNSDSNNTGFISEYSLMSESVAEPSAAPEPPPRSRRRKSCGLTAGDNSSELHASSSSGDLSINEVNMVEVKGQDSVSTHSSDYDNNNYISTVVGDKNHSSDSSAIVYTQEEHSPTTTTTTTGPSSFACKNSDVDNVQIRSKCELDFAAEPELPIVPPPSVFFKDEPESRLQFSSDDECETEEMPVNSAQLQELEDDSETTVIMVSKSTISDDDQFDREARPNTPPIPATPPPILSAPPSTRPETLPLSAVLPGRIPVVSSMPMLSPPSPYAGSVGNELLPLHSSTSLQHLDNNPVQNSDSVALATAPVVSASLPAELGDSENTATDADDDDIFCGLSEEDRKLIASVLRSDNTKTLDVLNECVEINQKILQQAPGATSSESTVKDKESGMQSQLDQHTNRSQQPKTSDTSDHREQRISNNGQVQMRAPSGVSVKTQLQKTPSDSRLKAQAEKALDEVEIKDLPQKIPDNGTKSRLQKTSSSDQLKSQKQQTSEAVEERTRPQNIPDDTTETEIQKTASNEGVKGQLQQTSEAAEIKAWQHDVTDSKAPAVVRPQEIVANDSEDRQQKTSDEFTHYISLIQGAGYNSIARKPGPIPLPSQISMEMDDDSEIVESVTTERTVEAETENAAPRHTTSLLLLTNDDISMSVTNSSVTEKPVDIDISFSRDTPNNLSQPEVAASVPETADDVGRAGVDNDERGTEADDVFSVCSGTSSSTDTVSGSDALSKSRRMLSSDQCVSDVMRAYYEEEDEVVQPQEEDAKKNKPKKPLIAQALLPKSARVSTNASGAAPAVPVSPTVTGGNLSSEQWQQQKRELTGITPIHNNVRLLNRGDEGVGNQTAVTITADVSPTVTGTQTAENKTSTGSSTSDILFDKMEKDKPSLGADAAPSRSSTNDSESIDVVVLPSVTAARKLFESQRTKVLTAPLPHTTTRSKPVLSTGSSMSSETDQEEMKKSVSSPLPPPVVTSDVRSSGPAVTVEIGFPAQTEIMAAEDDDNKYNVKSDTSAGTSEPDSAGLPGVAAARAMFESKKLKSSPFMLTKQPQKTTATKQKMPVAGVHLEQKNEPAAVSVVGKPLKETDFYPPTCLTPDSVDSSSVSSSTSTAPEVPSSASSDSGIETSSVATTKALFATKIESSIVGKPAEKKVQGSKTGKLTASVKTSESVATTTASGAVPSSESDILTEMPSMSNSRAFFESMKQQQQRPSATTGKCARSASLNTTRPGPPPVPHKTKHPSVSGVPVTTNQPTAATSTVLPANQAPSTTVTLATVTTPTTATSNSWTNFNVKSPAVRPQHKFRPAAHANHTESVGSSSEPTEPADTDCNPSVAASKALFESRKLTDKSSSLAKGGKKQSTDGSLGQTSVGRSSSLSAAHHHHVPTTPTSNSAAASGSSSLHPRPSFTSTDSSNSLKAWKSFISSYAAAGKEENK